jgi:hypothetical protein
MFPKMDREIIESVYQANNGNIDATIGAILEINGEVKVSLVD